MDVTAAATAAVSIAKDSANGAADLAAVKQKAVADKAIAEVVEKATEQLVSANKIDITV